MKSSLTKGLGLRDVAAGAKVDAKAVFRIASMTKSFTALAILKLRDAGKLRLDDPVNLYLPELREVDATDQGLGADHHPLSCSATPLDSQKTILKTTACSTSRPKHFWHGSQGEFLFRVHPAAASSIQNPRVHVAGQRRDNGLGPAVPAVHHRRDPPAAGDEFHVLERIEVVADRLAKGYRREKEAWAEEPLLEDGAGAAASGLMTSADDLGAAPLP